MKGAYLSAQQTTNGKTNFDNWSDKLPRRTKHKKITKNVLTEYDKKTRLNKFKSKTAYCQTADDIDNIRMKVRHGEPLLPHKDIRLLRLPPYSGLVLNLKDDGYHATSDYIKELIVLDDMLGKFNPNRTVLRCNRTVLNKLAEGLKVSEDAKKKGDTTAEVRTLMDLALNFMNSETSFYWLAEELLELAIGLLKDQQNAVDPHVEALLRYHVGSYLFEIAHDLAEAKSHIINSMRLSAGRSYLLVNVDGEREDILHFRSCVLLAKINLEEALEQYSIDIEEAIQSCRSALQWAKQADDNATTAHVLLTLAGFYLDAQVILPVLDILQEHIKLCKTFKYDRELCEGYILLSKYYETIGNDEEVVKVIEELISFAQLKGIHDIVLKAHIKLAEIYGTKRVEKMKHHAVEAFKYCQLAGNDKEMELTLCVVGIAQGHPLMCNYVNLMLNSGNIASDEFGFLIDWKMIRRPFSSGQHIFYQPENEENIRILKEIERGKTEEMHSKHKEKLRKLSYFARRSSSFERNYLSSGLMLQKSKTALSSQSLHSLPATPSECTRVTKTVSFFMNDEIDQTSSFHETVS